MDELVKELLETIRRKDEEISRLTNIVLEKVGYLNLKDQEELIESSPTRIRTGRQPWNDIKARMESLHQVKHTPQKPNWEEEANKAEFELFDLGKEISSAS